MIKFENVTMAYRKDGNPALNDVHLKSPMENLFFLLANLVQVSQQFYDY